MVKASALLVLLVIAQYVAYKANLGRGGALILSLLAILIILSWEIGQDYGLEKKK